MTELLQHTWGLRPKCCPQCGSPKFSAPAYVDTTTGEAIIEGKRLALAPKELAVLEAIVRAYPRGVGRLTLTEHVWPDRDYTAQTASLLSQHIHRLRKEFRRQGLSASIRNVHGAGFAIDFGGN